MPKRTTAVHKYVAGRLTPSGVCSTSIETTRQTLSNVLAIKLINILKAEDELSRPAKQLRQILDSTLTTQVEAAKSNGGSSVGSKLSRLLVPDGAKSRQCVLSALTTGVQKHGRRNAQAGRSGLHMRDVVSADQIPDIPSNTRASHVWREFVALYMR